MDPRESLAPIQRRDSEDERDVRIKKLEADNAELLRKLKRAKQLLIKLDEKRKAAKQAVRSQPEVLVCPVCGFDLHHDGGRQAEEEELLTRVEEDMRVSRASRRPPPSLSPRSASPPPSSKSPRQAVPRPAPVVAIARVHLTKLPFRVVCLVLEYVAASQAGRLSLALLNREWSRNVRLFVRGNGRSTRLASCLKNEEIDYLRGLEQLLTYRTAMEKAQVISGDESKLLFSNADTLARLSSILLRDLHERFAEWKPGDTVCDVFLIAVQGLRVYSSYYANNEVMLPGILALLKQKPDYARVVQTTRTQKKLSDLAGLLRSPLDRIDSYRVLISLLMEATPAGHADEPILAQVSAAMADALSLMNETRVAKEASVALSKTLGSVRDLPALRTNRDFVELRLLKDEECVRMARGRAHKPVRLILLNTCLVMATLVSRGDGKTWKCDQVFELSQVVKAEKSSAAVFGFATPDKSYAFQCPTEAGADGWVRALRHVDASAAAVAAKKKPASRFATLTKTLRSTK